MTEKNIIDFSKNKKTPFYVFDFDVLLGRVENIKKFLPDNAKLCYAIKANPFLIPALKDADILFEVCSPGELSICESYKVSPDKIVFSGVCKTFEDIRRAYLLNVKTITLESPLHCQYLVDAIKEADSCHIHEQEVILRLSSGNQFGMSENDILECIDKLKETDSVKIRGIHYFTGTQKKLNKIMDEVSFITNYCDELICKTGLSFSDIEYGPGLSFNYFSDCDENNNFEDLASFSNMIKNTQYSFVIELGRYIASSCGTYVTSVMDVKSNKTGSYCIIDGGINHINYYGQMMGMKKPSIAQYPKRTNSVNQKYTICGSLCTTADVVVRELELSEISPDDKLFFHNIGAYSITEGIYLFLSHPLPDVYIYSNNGFNCVRNTIESYRLNLSDNLGD